MNTFQSITTKTDTTEIETDSNLKNTVKVAKTNEFESSGNVENAESVENVETIEGTEGTESIENEIGITFCKRQSLNAEKGLGNKIWDEKGQEYLDFTSGWGVTCLGHSHPTITAAISEQAGKLIQNPNSGFTYSSIRAKLLTLLKTVTPVNLNHFYFANSGAEANDAALKLARKITGRCKVVSTTASFHGRTFNTLSVSGGPENIERYLPKSSNTQFVKFGDIGSIESAVDDQTAAVIVEPIQGEGGVQIASSKYLAALRKRCDETGAILIVDEIQTGFCRTGEFFALDHLSGKNGEAIEADILTMGKGIAGGFPFAGFGITSTLNSNIEKGDHGGTYCGNPLGCAVAYSVIRYLKEENVAGHVTEVGQRLHSELARLQQRFPELIESVRGQGLLCAMQFSSAGSNNFHQNNYVDEGFGNSGCDKNADELVDQFTQLCLQRGLLVTPTRKGIVRFIPSLLTTMAEISQAIELADSALVELQACKQLK